MYGINNVKLIKMLLADKKIYLIAEVFLPENIIKEISTNNQT